MTAAQIDREGDELTAGRGGGRAAFIGDRLARRVDRAESRWMCVFEAFVLCVFWNTDLTDLTDVTD